MSELVPEAEAAPEQDALVDEAAPAPAEEPKEDVEDLPAEEDELPRLRGPEHAAGELTFPPGYAVLEGTARGGRSVGIVVGRFNGELTNRLLAAALEELEAAGVPREAVTILPVPGAFELPLAAMALAKTRRFSCVIALGCIIRGETPHFDFIASEAASGLQLAAIETGIPVSFGVLTVESPEQAEARLEKGAEAARTALEMADLFQQLRVNAATAVS